MVPSAKERFVDTCRSRGKAAGQHIVHPDAENTRRALEEGYTLLALGVDMVFLRESAAKALAWASDQ